MKKDILGVYFDFFGTLVDSRHVLTNIWSRIAKKLGVEIASNDSKILLGMQKQWVEINKLNKPFIDLSRDEVLKLDYIVLDAIGVKRKGSKEIIREEFSDVFLTEMNFCMYPGCKETLEQIQAMEIKIGVLTHASRELCQIKMKELKILEFFDIFIHSEEFGYKKSEIEIYQIAMEAMGTMYPEKIIHIGDDVEMDVKMAQDIGMNPILFDPYMLYSIEDVITIRKLPEIMQYL